MTALPRLMVAPNGARRTKADHPALPMTIAETVATARACRDAGAQGIHAHVRDADGAHTLDHGLYRELLAELDAALPGFFVQITSEAAGRFGPDAQMAMIEAVRPASVSLALAEIALDDADLPRARAFYHRMAGTGTTLHHIAYTARQRDRVLGAIASGTIPPAPRHQMMLVLGSYADATPGRPQDLPALAAPLGPEIDWMLCAFGPSETACLVEAVRLGGKARVGFENNLTNVDGTRARDNAERVAEVARAIGPAAPRRS